MVQQTISETAPSAADGGAELIAWAHRTREACPVGRDAQGVWNVVGAADAQRVLSEPASFSSNPAFAFPAAGSFRGNMLWLDPPEHRKLRTIVSRVFVPRAVSALEPKIRQVAAELLDAVGDADEIELISAFTQPLPVIVIAELLGIPSLDLAQFKAWADRMLGAVVQDPLANEDARREIAMGTMEMNAYLLEHVRRKRAAPRDDLLSRLVATQVGGERLDDQEVVNFSRVLLEAGHVTTTMMLSNAIWCFEQDPGLAAALRADRALLPGAIEELLRYRPPVLMVLRYTPADVELAGVLIPAGSVVKVWIVAANRDPRQFDRPDSFDPGRHPNGHVAFGKGVHYCLGSQLARLEGELGLNLLFDRFADLRITPGADLEFYPQNFFGMKRLPVTVTRTER
ncbi:cytochrome P450 [Actinomadura sp. WMMB 499]|uniref:cytochrome P450 n=1 Tax=Actinomadura sp. WMMB 499 TaxID=1219491 RepID=UPI001247B8EF|nr:cytochrome P450 [Actinomadura sp. WMMB 499]QFG20259.1 cytochrome P450 [Actinomadura sp. WMMB 499]